MSTQAMAHVDYELLPRKIQDVEYLAEMALDLRNCWVRLLKT